MSSPAATCGMPTGATLTATSTPGETNTPPTEGRGGAGLPLPSGGEAFSEVLFDPILK